MGPALCVFAAFALWPIVMGLGIACYDWDPVKGIADPCGLANFEALAEDPVFRTALRNNLVWIALSLLVQVPLALLLAASLADASRASRALRTIVFSPLLLPGVAIGLIFTVVYDGHFGALNALLTRVTGGLVETGWISEERLALWSLIAVACWQYTGFHTMILLTGMQSISVELYEAAALDGAGWWQRLRSITVPLVRRVVLVDMLLVAIGSVKVFDIVQVMTEGGPHNATHVLATYVYHQAFMSEKMGRGAAVAVVMLAIALGLTAIHAWLAAREERER